MKSYQHYSEPLCDSEIRQSHRKITSFKLK